MFARHWIALSMLFALSGCGLFENPISCNPGPTSYQVSQARRFDPYPDPTTGTPIVGGRPIDYMEPRPEPDVTKNPRYWLGGTSPASAYPAAPAYVAPPPATVAPVQVTAPTSYAPPASGVIPASAMVPIPPPTLPAATPPAAAISRPAAPIAYGTKIDGP
jgi:hypothetical protein